MLFFFEDEIIEDIEKVDMLKTTTQDFVDFGPAPTPLENVNYGGDISNEVDANNEANGADIEEKNVEADMKPVQELRWSDIPHRLPTRIALIMFYSSMVTS
jgi:hypothetical protein